MQQKTSLVLQRYFGNLPIVESKAPLLVIPNEQDTHHAVSGDPAKCAMSRACGRIFGSKAVVFFRTIAYVDLPTEDGNRAIHRFRNPEPLTRAIVKFDQTGTFPLAGFALNPTKGRGLKAGLKYSRARRRAIENGKWKPRPHKKYKGTTRKKALSLVGVRSGSGLLKSKNVR